MSDYEGVDLGKYLFTRIKQLGISHILGCPGDFNCEHSIHLIVRIFTDLAE